MPNPRETFSMILATLGAPDGIDHPEPKNKTVFDGSIPSIISGNEILMIVLLKVIL